MTIRATECLTCYFLESEDCGFVCKCLGPCACGLDDEIMERFAREERE